MGSFFLIKIVKVSEINKDEKLPDSEYILTKVDEDGDPWILDSNNDGICDRIHAVDEFGDGRYYHVHHVSLALGNGQALETAAIRGVVIRNLNPSETYYPVAYGHWDDDTEGQEP